MREDEDFRRHADETLTSLYRALVSASEDYDFKATYNARSITLELGKGRSKIVVSPHAAARQVWVSAHHKSYKLEWDVVQNTFVLGSTGQTLKELIEEAISRQVGEDVTL